MDAYAVALLVALARTVLVYGVVFVALPLVFFPGAGSRGRVLGDAAMTTTAAMLIAIGLGQVGLVDAFSMAIGLGILFAVGGWSTFRRSWRRESLLWYGRVLWRLEDLVTPRASIAEAPPVPRARMLPTHAPAPLPPPAPLPEDTPQRAAALGVGLAITLAAIAIRLVPALSEPAPFAVRYFADLEAVHALMRGDPVAVEGGWGLHALAATLAVLTQVDPALLLRGLGALGAGALVLAVYGAVRTAGGTRGGALVGAATVGLGGALLPIPLDRQVEADSLVLAAALGVASLPSIRAYVARGHTRDLLAALAAVVGCGLTHVVAGALVATGLVWVAVARVVQVRDRAGRVGRLVVGNAVGLGLGAVALVALGRAYRALLEAAPPGSIASLTPNDVLARGVPLGAALLVGLGTTLVGWRRGRAGLLWTGATVTVLALVWVVAEGGAPGLEGAAASQLTAAIAVAVGLAVGPLASRVARAARARGLSTRGQVAAGGALAVALASLTAWGTVLAPQARPGVEPPGYARAYLAIQRSSEPYAWTAVGQRGLGVRARHRGRYMDYEYFLSNYEATRYDHTGDGAIPTRDLFIFLDKDPDASLLVDELQPLRDGIAQQATEWVAVFAARGGDAAEVFYDDADVRVVRITRPAASLLDASLADASRPR